MAYTVTALKWRPQRFDEVVGQEHITKTLKNAIANGRIAHAYIFAGPRGVGKTTTARILAKRLNCLNPQGGEPCNECEMCKLFQSGQTMDVIEIDGASNRRIDEIRTLRESVKYAPTSGKYKIYIIDEVHMLTTESFNALLKTLEEPPEHTVFIFATTDIHKVPLTIISRCQRFDFRRIELGEIKKLLAKIAKAEGIEIDDESLTIIAKKADGALRDAQSLFDQVVSYCGTQITADEVRKMLNLIDEDIYFNISDAILNKEFSKAYETVQILYENGWNFIDFVTGLIEHFRNIMALAVTGTSKFIEASESTKLKYESLGKSFSESDLLRILTFLTQLLSDVKIAQNQKLTVEIGLSKLIGLEKSSSISELISLLKSGKIPEPRLGAPAESEKKKIEVNPQEEAEEVKPQEFNAPEPTPVKETPQEEYKPAAATKAPAELKFEKVKSAWKDFLKTVNRKKFAIGSRLLLSEPLGLVNGILEVAIKEESDIEFFKKNADALASIFEEYFGNKVEFNFSSKVQNLNDALPDDDLSDVEEDNSEPTNENDPFVKAIIEKLGGREIK